MKEQVLEKEVKKIDYRHFISVLITLAFLSLGVFVFPNAAARLAESFRDLGYSIAYWFCEVTQIEADVPITVTKLPSWQIAESKFHPLDLIPFTWDEFEVAWKKYWEKWIEADTFKGYGRFLSDVIYYVAQGMMFILPLFGICLMLFENYMKSHNNDYGKDSGGVRFWKKVSDLTYRKAKRWVKGYVAFLKGHVFYWKLWKWLWAYYFNFITIVVEFFAFYFYFVFSFDFIDIYRQVYKLILDLSTVVRFVPVLVQVAVVVALLEKYAHKIGYGELDHRERMNRGFWNERGIVTAIYANMGKGKTELMTDGGLSGEVELRDRAFDVIVECDFTFPNFPWAKLEQELKIARAFHVVYDLSSIRRWVRKKYRRWLKDQRQEKIFGYDFERYGLYHNNALKVESVWQCIEDYACAYFVYAVQCSLILSNYSVRSDVDCIDFGNFPRWNTDFFRRDPALMAAFSRRSHILDFDILRFGKRVLENNPNRHALGFGVYLITEIDKERKNDLQNKELKASANEANQKNDLFNPLLKMIRHAAMIRNRVFIILLCDLQRPEDWGAGGREVGEVVEVLSQSDCRPVLPFWAPFWFFEAIFLTFFKPFVNLYYDYRTMRSDNTVPIYGAKGFLAKLNHVYERIYNTFGSIRVSVEVESGRMNGDKESKYYYKNVKKSRMERYGTDCLSGMFESYAADNRVGIADLAEYADKMATQEELRKQNSYMQNDVYNAQMAA